MKNVLLLGNGIDRSFNSNPVSWGELLDKMTTNPAVPAHAPLPFPLEVVLRTNDHVDEALKEHSRELAGSVKDARLREVLTRLLTMGFDDILTTIHLRIIRRRQNMRSCLPMEWKSGIWDLNSWRIQRMIPVKKTGLSPKRKRKESGSSIIRYMQIFI